MDEGAYDGMELKPEKEYFIVLNAMAFNITDEQAGKTWTGLTSQACLICSSYPAPVISLFKLDELRKHVWYTLCNKCFKKPNITDLVEHLLLDPTHNVNNKELQ